jgi:hypothetical protein
MAASSSRVLRWTPRRSSFSVSKANHRADLGVGSDGQPAPAVRTARAGLTACRSPAPGPREVIYRRAALYS